MTTKKPLNARSLLLIIGILLIATTIRAPITGIAPVLDMVRASFSLGTAEAGILTTLPLLAFALTSPFSVLFARKYGLERSLFGALLLITSGIIIRSLGNVWCLFAGTALIGVGIAFANVLLPSLLKRDFPDRIASLTGAYSVTAGAAAAFASATAIPIAAMFINGWNWALASFALFPVIAMIVWLPQLSNHTAPSQASTSSIQNEKIWKSPLAWQVTLFFGLNSLVYYVIVAWLPMILAESGYSPAVAGSLHGVSQFATAIPGLIFGAVLSRFRDQRIIAVSLAAMTAISLFGLLLLPAWSVLWVALFGFGAGATFILALAFIALRSANAHQAAALSGMAQCIGYLIAAAAPPLAGLIHDKSQGWALTLIICIILCGAMAFLGFQAGKQRLIFNQREATH